MESQNQSMTLNSEPIVEPVKKCNHLPIIIILTVLTMAGFGFGGYELWQNIKKDDEIKNLQAENNKKVDEIEKLQAMIEKKEQSENKIGLTDEQAFELIEEKRKSLGYDTWVASEVKVLKRGSGDDNNYFYIEYIEENVDGGRNPLRLFFHYVNNDWEFSIPGFSGMTGETFDWLNTFVDI